MNKSPERLVFDAFLKDELLPALKSGEHKHGTSYLEQSKNDEVFRCCLGVACFIHPNVVKTNWDTHPHTAYTTNNPGNMVGSSLSYLPISIARSWDVDPSIIFRNKDRTSSLNSITSVNDYSTNGYAPVIEVFEKYIAGDIEFVTNDEMEWM